MRPLPALAAALCALLSTRLLNAEEPRAALEIRVAHREVDCDAAAKDQLCGDKKHWSYAIEEKEVAAGPELLARIKKEADAGRDSKDERSRLSNSSVELLVDWNAPYGMVQQAMSACANSGIYKIAWRGVSFRELKAAKASGKDVVPTPATPVWLPHDDEEESAYFPEEGDPSPGGILEARVLISFDPKTGGTTLKLGSQEVAGEDELLQKLESQIAGAKKAEIPYFPVVFDAPAVTPFRVIAHLTEICRAKNLAPLTFAGPLPERPDGK